MLFARLAALVLPALPLAVAAVDEEDNPNLRQLTEDDFKTATASGAWLVEHYSPRCPHCRAFAPTWGRLVNDLKHLEQLSGFHMAQVNCLAQYDLCNDNHIQAYPQLNLYLDGEFNSEYKDDRNYDFLRKWIEHEATNYARTVVLGTGDDTSTVTNTPYIRRPNPEGKVVEVDRKGLAKYKEEGPVFADFYAPWCGHCKALRPILDKLAGELQGSMNVIAINCVEHASLCQDNNIQSYPTLRLLNGSEVTEYMKARSVSGMKEFLEPYSIEPKILPLKVGTLDQLAKDEDVFFIYLQNFGTTLDDWKLVQESVKPFLGKVPIYTSNDPQLYTDLGIANPVPSSVLVAFAGHSTKPVATLSLPTPVTDAVPKFLVRHQDPLVVSLNKESYETVIEKNNDDLLVVLGIVHSDERGKEERANLETMARAVRHGARDDYRLIRFAAMDDALAATYQTRYGIKSADLPIFVVVNPAKDVYYDGTIEGARAQFTGEDAFSVLEGVFHGWLKAKQVNAEALGAPSHSLKTWSTQHPFKAGLLGVFWCVGLVWVFMKVRRRRIDLHAAPRGGYMNEKGLSHSLSHSYAHKSDRLD